FTRLAQRYPAYTDRYMTSPLYVQVTTPTMYYLEPNHVLILVNDHPITPSTTSLTELGYDADVLLQACTNEVDGLALSLKACLSRTANLSTSLEPVWSELVTCRSRVVT